MDNGWIKLHRKILLNPIAQKASWAWLWVVLLLKANHKEQKMIWNNNIIIVHNGEFITGRKKLSEETGISETTIERILSHLEKNGKIGQQKTTKYRLISIVNWKSYQEVDNKRTTNGQQTDTNKNDKKDKKDKNSNIYSETSSLVSEIIKSFESINPASKGFYGNKTQRNACNALIEAYTFDRVMVVVKKTLPKTNKLKFFPKITTPLQLWEKWSALESAIISHKQDEKKYIL